MLDGGRRHLGDLPGVGRDIGTGKLLHQFLGPLDHRIRHPGQLGHLDAVALIGPALYDLPQEYNIVALLLDGDTVVVHAVYGALQLGQLVIVGGEQRLGPQEPGVADVLDHRPCDGKSVKGTGPPADLVQDQEAVLCGVP